MNRKAAFAGWFALLAFAAVATSLPGADAWFLWDRHALGRGELWRLWTGHFFHFSAAHLAGDVVAFALLVSGLRATGDRPAWVLGVGAPALSLSLLTADGSLTAYGGLSGVNALFTARLARQWINQPGPSRALGWALLTLAVGKFTLDLSGLHPIHLPLASALVTPCHLSHWLGLLWGCLLPTGSGRNHLPSVERRRSLPPPADDNW